MIVLVLFFWNLGSLSDILSLTLSLLVLFLAIVILPTHFVHLLLSHMFLDISVKGML